MPPTICLPLKIIQSKNGPIYKSHNSWYVFSEFIQKLFRSSFHHYQSIHHFCEAQFLWYFADKGKMPKFTKGNYSCPEARGPSNYLLITSYLFIKLWGSSSNSIWDILLTKEKCPNLQRAITHEIFFRIYSEVNQVIYSPLPIKSPSFKALAPIVF